jgi:hypothetical protein
MTDRQLKLEKIINEINENYGFGNGYVDENTDVDKFIADFKYKFLVHYDLSHILNTLNESNTKSYVEQFNEI